MRKGLTEMVFILDRSGSMNGLERDTIGGFNGMLGKQRGEPGEANVTTVLFDDKYEIIHDRVSIEAVRPMTEREYYTRGCTALLDAVGRTISRMGNVQKYMPEELRAEKVIFVIVTDGYENSSREYDWERVRRMIRRQKEKYGWEFLFLGANMDAEEEAEKFGIQRDRAATYSNDSEGVGLNFVVMEKTIRTLRSMDDMSMLDDSWKEEIEKCSRRGE